MSEDTTKSDSTTPVNTYKQNLNPIKLKRRNNHIIGTEDPASPVAKDYEEESTSNDSVEASTSLLETLKLAPQEHLKDLQRVVCPNCKKKRKYFCYECLMPMGDPSLSSFIPLKLPLDVDIVHHPTEQVSKSTAIHAKVISPDQVHMHEFPDIPDYNKDETIILFPSTDSLTVQEVDFNVVKKVVFVDSQWQKTKTMIHHPKLAGIKCVRIDLQKTLFWRYQACGDNCLATIEAIYYFFKEYQQKITGNYNGEYDNLLYYYTLIYNIIQKHYKDTQKSFPRIDNYIK